ncbi:MAG: carbohydrate-binding family 9-like protein, partial [Phycisphaerae bacterium]|nr:carbohydrate-binding family 9-like protein [Phycisphaerae bacterium]
MDRKDFRRGPDLAQVQSRFVVWCDELSLHVRISCDEPEVKNLRAATESPGGSVWMDDCVEVFLDPDHGHEHYSHFLVNPRGALTAFKEGGHFAALKGTQWLPNVGIKTNTGERSWEVTLSIPFKELNRAMPGPGETWGLNVTRKRRAGGSCEESCWSPTLTDTTIHVPSRFGDLVFGKVGVGIESVRIGTANLSFRSPDWARGNHVPWGTSRCQIKTKNLGFGGTCRWKCSVLDDKGKCIGAFSKTPVPEQKPAVIFNMPLKASGRMMLHMEALDSTEQRLFSAKYPFIVLEPISIFVGNVFRDSAIVSCLLARPEQKKLQLRAEIHTKNHGDTPVSSTESSCKGNPSIELPLPKDLPAGEYLISARLQDSKGKTIASDEKKVVIGDSQIEGFPVARLPEDKPGLMLSPERINLIRERIASGNKLANKMFEELSAECETWLAENPKVKLPRCSTWGMCTYKCPRHAVRLENVSPHSHRCPVDGEIIKGRKYDDAWAWFLHGQLIIMAAKLGICYQLTGERRFGEGAKNILL